MILDKLVKHAQVAAAFGIIAIGTGSMYSQTLGLGRYRQIAAQYKDGEEQPLDEATFKMAEQIMMKCDLSAEEEASLEFFLAYGQDPCHRGSLKLRTGALVGLPGTFAYQSTNQVQKDKIKINNAPIDWESRGGELLLKSIVLSEKAKSFAIAREIEYANTHHIWSEGLLKMGFVFTGYATGFFLNNFFRLKRVLKPWARGALYSFIGVTFYGLYLLMDDTYYCHRDHAIDKRVTKMGVEYAEGGLEFYNKLLQRNIALRFLLGPEGAKVYTAYGNEVTKWRRPHATLTERRDYFAKYLQDMSANEMDKTSEEIA